MKHKKLILWMALVFYAIGLALLFLVDWKIVAGVFIILWASNIEKMAEKHGCK